MTVASSHGLDDAQFHAALSRRYADASEEVERLKCQIVVLQEERDQYRDHHVQSKGQASSSSQPPQTGRDLQTLSSVGTALERAREEYNKLKGDVKAAQDQIHALNARNAELDKELAVSRAECHTLSDNFSEAKMAQRKLEERCATWEREFKSAVRPPTVHAPSDDVRDQEIKALRASLAAEQATTAALRHELSLIKAKPSDFTKAIMTTVHSSLQAASTSLHKRSDSQPNPIIRRVVSRASSAQRSLAEVRLPEVAEAPTMNATYTSLPGRRAEELSALLGFKWKGKAPQGHTGVSFRRKFLSDHIGGPQSLISVPSKQTTFAIKSNIKRYLCPDLDQNPWCPSAPGEHGYMFIASDKDRDTIKDDQTYSLFVGMPDDDRGAGRFKYLGIYRVHHSQELSLDEWHELPDQVKSDCCATIHSQSSKLGSVEDVKAGYDTGRVFLYCVRLQCVGFDDHVLEYLSKVRLKARPSMVTIPSAAKRRRDHQDVGDLRHRKMKSLT